MPKIVSHVSADFRVIREILSRPFFAFLAGTGTFLFFLFASWLPNFFFIVSHLVSSRLYFSERALFFLSSFLPFDFPAFGVAVLFGVNMALLGYLFSLRFRMTGGGGVGALGMLLGVSGAGCASCGTALFPFLGFSGALAFLPFGGTELLAVGAGLLAISISASASRIRRSRLCAI